MIIKHSLNQQDIPNELYVTFEGSNNNASPEIEKFLLPDDCFDSINNDES